MGFGNFLKDLKTGTSSGGTGFAGKIGSLLQGKLGNLLPQEKKCPTGFDAQGNRVCPWTCNPLQTQTEKATGVSDAVTQATTQETPTLGNAPFPSQMPQVSGLNSRFGGGING